MTEMRLEGNLLSSHDDIPEYMRWLVSVLDSGQPISLDTETYDANKLWDPRFQYGGFCRLFQIGTAEEGWAIPAKQWNQLCKETMDLVARADNDVFFANAKYDQHVFANERWAIVPWHRVYDTVIMSRMAHPEERQHGLKQVAGRVLGSWATAGQAELNDRMATHRYTWDTIPANDPYYVKYGLLDTMLTVRVGTALEMTPWAQVEHDFSALSWGMERTGLKIDHSALDQAVQQWEAEKQQSEAALAGLGFVNAKGEPKPGSDVVVRNTFEKLGYFSPSFNKDVLGELKDVPGDIGAAATNLSLYRRAAKYITTYGTSLRDACYGGDVVRPNIQTMKARTGRMSITNPPLQTIPGAGPARSCFVPHEKGNSLLAVDYDAQETRIEANLSGDTAMAHFFAEGDGDWHSYTAELAGIERKLAKVVNFAGAYNAQVPTMARQAGIGEGAMQVVVDSMKSAFPESWAWRAEQVAVAKRREQEFGYAWVDLPYGRRAVLDRGNTFTTATNTVIQGTGADIVKLAGLRLADEGYASALRLPIHDEWLLELPTDEAEQHGKVIEEIMTDYNFDIPITATSSKPLARWSEAK